MKVIVDKSVDIINERKIVVKFTLDPITFEYISLLKPIYSKDEYEESKRHENLLLLDLRGYVDDFILYNTAFGLCKTICKALNIKPPDDIIMNSSIAKIYNCAGVYFPDSNTIHFPFSDCSTIFLIHELAHHYINVKNIKYTKVHGKEFMDAETLLVDTLISLC